MKLSMWHILQELEEFQPEYHITDGAPRIAGLHLHTRWDDGTRLGQYAYLELQGDGRLLSDEDAAFTMSITNGEDAITVRDLPDPSMLVNRLMALLADFNDWEGRLHHAAERGDLQEIVDVATEKLMNPILLFDMQSNVLAMSSLFLDDARDEFWASARQTRRVPIGYTAQTLKLENGETAAWTREPRLYTVPGGGRTIGNFISVEGEIAAGFALHEADNPILPGDMFLVRLVEEMLSGAMEPQRESGVQRSLLQSLQDMLGGVEYDDHVYSLFRLPCAAPWRLVLVGSPDSGNGLYRQLLLPRLRGALPGCVALEFDTYLAAICAADDLDALIRLIGGGQDKLYFSVALSLPFDSLRLLHIRYRQTRFVLEACGHAPGVHRAEDHALRYLAGQEFARREQLAHPLLSLLKEQDARKGSELYETLFQYLLNERSIQKGAAALHVHKNTYSYRLERIKELSDANLDDPLTRLYLMVSYVIDGALDRQGG